MLTARSAPPGPPRSPAPSGRSLRCAGGCRWRWRSPRPAPKHARTSRSPRWPPSCRHGSRLDALDAGDPAASVRAVFSWSYRSSAPRRRGCSGCWACTPARTSAPPLPPAWPRQAGPGAPPAGRAHPRAPARRARPGPVCAARPAARLRRGSSPRHREPARAHRCHPRALDHYLHTARNGASIVHPSFGPITLPPPSPGTAPEQLTGHDQALAWFEAEYHVLLAAVTLAVDWGLDNHGWQISWAMHPFLATQGHRYLNGARTSA